MTDYTALVEAAIGKKRVDPSVAALEERLESEGWTFIRNELLNNSDYTVRFSLKPTIQSDTEIKSWYEGKEFAEILVTQGHAFFGRHDPNIRAVYGRGPIDPIVH